MKKFTLLKCLLVMQAFFFMACEPEPMVLFPEATPVAHNFLIDSNGDYFEDFENVSKTSYAGANVTFNDGEWYFEDALIGGLSGDSKNGAKSVRMRYNGVITMGYDLPDGIKTVSLRYAKYNRDSQTSFELYYSTDAGATWTKGGDEIHVKKTNLETANFSINVQGNVRLEIRKTDGKSDRLNIDDIIVQSNPITETETLVNITEDYESGSKRSYAAGIVSLPSGDWYLEEALIGSLDNDRKTGLKSVRIRDYGILQMNYDVVGATSVSLSHALYGTDGSSSWELQASTDGGVNWSKIGNTVSTSSTILETINFSVNYSENVRFRLLKLSGSGDRINIDDFVIGGTQDTESDTGGGTAEEPIQFGEVHLTMGNPSNALTDITIPNNYLLKKEEYVMSYSRDKGTANWVSWHLDESWRGNASRQNDFREDNTLPSSWYKVNETDYRYSGFDRGHLCPSADRTISVEANSNTFFMTNMMPQAPNNNRNVWASLESYCRSLLSEGYELYIISGGYGVGGDGSEGYAEYIANGKVTVPSNTWKVIMVLPVGDDDVNRVTTNTQVIAVDIPNSQNVSSDWTQYSTSVDDIEILTGNDFFNLVPDHIEDVIEDNIYIL
ncbi:DNA/RNA non-specific endonuclease [Salegentibacter sp. JZCK2]|uniref:DNA/RNA non-specific endonuclease n=1 Tax=Salegentibacter tibetensis TaxID=2873600 RepID=UPI001CCA785F|nr:DNA/RNA non-specific endonuclease [Salegentibacter tibetensis]MBZ9731175.1 DNA/RNA non-specific endonuclease [Salegentibacter tibetensis]